MTKQCTRCESFECYDGKDCFGLTKEAREAYSENELKSMRVSGEIEAEHYMKMCRLEEIMLYAKDMNFQKLGVAFCVGLSTEAKVLDKILTSKGFTVCSACCKICGMDKADLGVRKLHGAGSAEAVCNPAGQALRLNSCGTDMNIAIGLCVGHDMLFAKHSKAPVTTFVVKDRVLAHNPIGALYSSYYLETKFGLRQ